MDRISGPLKELLGRLRLAEPMRGYRAVEVWAEVVGDRVAAHARAVACRRGTLYVEVANAAWMNELGYLRSRIQRELNEKVGEEVVHTIRLLPAGAYASRVDTRGDD
jgi:predicted nucleic acid-binding Zn ribbon protein